MSVPGGHHPYLHPGAAYIPHNLPTFQSQHSATVAGAAGYFTSSSTVSRPPSSLSAAPAAASSSFQPRFAPNRGSSTATANNIPLVGPDYGYGHSGHVQSGMTASNSAPDTSRAGAYAQIMGESTLARQSQARGGATAGRARGRGGSGRGLSNTSRNLLQMAGYSSHFVKEGEAPKAPLPSSSYTRPAYSSTGRNFGRPPRRGGAPRGSRGVSTGGVTKRPTPSLNGPAQKNALLNLGKSILPRPATVIVQELLKTTGLGYQKAEATDQDYEDFNDEHGYYPNYLHKMDLKVMGRTYSAIAETKKDAREKCAEKCFPDILEVQMKAQKRRPKQLEPTGRPMAYEHMEDEVPFASLCSLAIHKLYTDWQEEGFDIPDHLLEFSGAGQALPSASKPPTNPSYPSYSASSSSSFRPPLPPSQPSGPPIHRDNLSFKYVDFPGGPGGTQQAQIPTATAAQQARWSQRPPPGPGPGPGPGRLAPPVGGKLVEYPNGKVVNPVSKHPVGLLNELVPNLQYQQQQFGTRKLHFVTTIEVNGQSYVGEAANKKDAKLFAAVNALKGAYGIEYPSCPTQEAPA